MVWHYHDDDVPGPDAAVEIALAGLPAEASGAKLTHYRIDETHSNSYGEWRRMGSPIAPNEQRYAQLKKASELATLGEPTPVALANGGGKVTFALPRQGVSLLVFDWSAPAN
ncbi:MAG TPA: hypothetical protein VHO24_11680 [Opitutaceae bacterium]|nr:hypothetical protein [Opitutaceae bacterium]